MYRIEPIRKGLIIGSPGEGENYLHGVSSDVENLTGHLCAEQGGLWNKPEIHVLWKPGIRELESALKKQTADYTFTYFSGHGFTSTDGSRMIKLRDYVVNDLSLLNESPRQFCLLDCCRDKEPPAITGIPELPKPFKGIFTAREIFNQYILASDSGIKVVHGTGSGFPAFDESSRRGGLFTLNFLKAAETIQKQIDHRAISLDEILERTASYLKAANSCQVPEIVFEEGNLQVPFALSVNKKPGINIKNNWVQKVTKFYDRPVPRKTNNWVIPGLILAAILLSDNDR